MFKNILSALAIATIVTLILGPGAQTLQAWFIEKESLDLKASSVSFESIIYEELSLARVELVDTQGNPLEGISVEMYASHPDVDIFQASTSSDAQGLVEFWILAHTKDPFKVMVKERLSQNVIDRVYELQAEGSFLELASEAGPVASFKIELDSDILLLGETNTFSVEAVDANGVRVTDYTGTVRFSSSDSQAELPADFSFKAEHSGKQTFSLGLRFINPGSHRFEVRDIENFSLFGEKTLKVVMDASLETNTGSSSSEDSDFVTSPASGEYSSSEIRLSGKANYGESIRIILNGKEINTIPVEFNKNEFNFDLKNLPDGEHSLVLERYLDQEVLEKSDPISLKIDTTAPKILQITAIQDPLKPGEQSIEILSEAKLSDAYVLYETELFPLTENSKTPGKYEVSLPSPSESSSIDVILVDALGNEAEIKKALALEPSQALEEKSDEAVKTVIVRAGENSAILSWEKPQSKQAIAYYRVHYGPSRDSIFANVDTLDASTLWTIDKLPAGEEIFVAIQAIYINGEKSPMSEIYSTIPLKGADYSIPKNLGLSLEEDPRYQEFQNKPSKTADSGAPLFVFGLMALGLSLLYTRKKSML